MSRSTDLAGAVVLTGSADLRGGKRDEVVGADLVKKASFSGVPRSKKRGMSVKS